MLALKMKHSLTDQQLKAFRSKTVDLYDVFKHGTVSSIQKEIEKKEDEMRKGGFMAVSTGDRNTCGVVVKDAHKWIELLVQSCHKRKGVQLEDDVIDLKLTIDARIHHDKGRLKVVEVMCSPLQDWGKGGDNVISLGKWAFDDSRAAILSNLKKGMSGGLYDMLESIQKADHVMIQGHAVKVVFWETHDYKAWCDVLGDVSILGSHFDIFNRAVTKGDRGAGEEAWCLSHNLV
jgi:hypothetical protein